MFEWCAHILRLRPHDQDWIVHLKNLSWTCVFCCVKFLHVLVGIWACFGADPKLGQICRIHFHVKLCPLITPNVCWTNNKKHPSYSNLICFFKKSNEGDEVRCASFSAWMGSPPHLGKHRWPHIFGVSGELWRIGYFVSCWCAMCA